MLPLTLYYKIIKGNQNPMRISLFKASLAVVFQCPKSPGKYKNILTIE
jgi:hypothetical protein